MKLKKALVYLHSEKMDNKAVAKADVVLVVEEPQPKKRGGVKFRVVKDRHGVQRDVDGSAAQSMIARAIK